MILPDPQSGEKLEKDPGTRASFVPSPHPYASPCSSGDASIATQQSRAAPELPAKKGSIVASYEYVQVQERKPTTTTVGEEQWIRHDCHSLHLRKHFFSSFLVDLLPNYSYLYQTGSTSNYYQPHEKKRRRRKRGNLSSAFQAGSGNERELPEGKQ